ncbi:MAG: YbaB/EbfC family nucleoid-associated protein [Myxococcaceae bacterium]
MFDVSKLNDLMKNAFQLQEKMTKELGSKSVEASAGAGMVKITMNGHFDVTTVSLDPSLLAMNDLDFTQDLIKSAINDAIKQVKQLVSDQAKSMIP